MFIGANRINVTLSLLLQLPSMLCELRISAVFLQPNVKGIFGACYDKTKRGLTLNHSKFYSRES